MSHTDVDTLLAWRGRTVRDEAGEELGKLGELFLDDETDLPAYASVRTGLFGRKETIVPLEGIREDGDELVLPHSAEHVRGAPSLDPDGEALTDEEEARLAEHYGATGSPGRDAGHEEGAEVVRSEEEVDAHAGPMRPRERVRIRKVLVTDHVKKVVPVRREVVEVEEEPAGAGDDDPRRAV